MIILIAVLIVLVIVLMLIRKKECFTDYQTLGRMGKNPSIYHVHVKDEIDDEENITPSGKWDGGFGKSNYIRSGRRTSQKNY